MPILKNARHEKFAQLVASGKSATEAMALAGYAKNHRNTTQLKTNKDVAARIAELQTKAAENHEITRDKITKMLLEDRKGARAAGQFAAAKSATESLGRLHGLYIEKSERDVTHSYVARMPQNSDDADDWAAQYAPKQLTNGHAEPKSH